MKTFITGALCACLLVPLIDADAQADQARIPPIGDVTPAALARFKLEAVRFRAHNETGIDRLGSDEVKVVIWAPGSQTVTQEFDDVDAGETTEIPLNQSCILPIAGGGDGVFRGDRGDTWHCSPSGAAGPFSFKVELREIDFLGCRFSGYAGCALIGRHTVKYSTEELTALQVGQAKEESVTLSPCAPTPEEPEIGCAGFEADYQFTWRLTRLPNAEPLVGPITHLQEPYPGK